MFELISLALAALATIGGYIVSRRFVRGRLRYVDGAQRVFAPLLAGVAAAVLAMPITWLLPLVGGGTAVLFGAGVGAGVATGARDIRRRLGAG